MVTSITRFIYTEPLENIALLKYVMTKINKDYIIYNLDEAKAEIESIIKNINNDPSYEYGDFLPAMKHLYHHVNTAWNSKYSSEKESHECSQDDFIQWRQFPNDIDMN